MARSWYEVLHWSTDGGVAGYSESTVWRALRERAPMPPSVVARLIRSGDFRLLERALRLGCIEARSAVAVLTTVPPAHAAHAYGFSACVLQALDIVAEGDVVQCWAALQQMARDGTTYTAMATLAGHRTYRGVLRMRDEAELIPLHEMFAMGSSVATLEVFEREALLHTAAADLAQIRGDTALALARVLDDYSGGEVAMRRATCLARCAVLGGFTDELRDILAQKALCGQLRSPGSADVLLQSEILLPEAGEACARVTRQVDAMAASLWVEGVTCEIDGVVDGHVTFLVAGGMGAEEAANEAAQVLSRRGLCAGASARYDEDARVWLVAAPLAASGDALRHLVPRRIAVEDVVRA